MATALSPAARSRILAFVDNVLAEASLPMHLKREARMDFIAHLEADAVQALQRGASEPDAVEAAIRSFGGVADVRGALYRAASTTRPRGVDRLRLAHDGLVRGLREAGRRLWSHRLTTAVAIFT